MALQNRNRSVARQVLYLSLTFLALMALLAIWHL
jgi:hypothetical protein